jgi:DNA-binding response OmpR family regulator
MTAAKTILFVDDNPVDRTLIQRLLAKNGFNVILAEDGPAGMRMAKENRLDLILLDILLPHISGIELCQKFKEDVATFDIPIIFYTSLDTPKNLIDYASYGACDYIQKTTSPEDLIASIKAVLE